MDGGQNVMVSLEHTLEISASPEKVWTILSALTRSPEYVPGIVSAAMEDLTRVCFDSAGNEIREMLQYYSAPERKYTLQHIKVPLPVSSSQMQFSVHPHEQQSLVTLRWELSFLDAVIETQLKPMLDGSVQMTLTQFKTLVEKE
jgi:hypothetical protein